MTPDERSRSAQAILAIPLYGELMDELEAAAVNAAVYAQPTDHEARQAHLAQVKAIRDLRSRVEVLAKEDQSTKRRQAPA
jgi:hypothetical protein